MSYRALQRLLVGPLRRHVLFFEAQIERAIQQFSQALRPGMRVLDAGAGEAQYAPLFRHCQYVAVDLGVGDSSWDYSRLDAVADLSALPFADACFHAALNIVTLEHVPEPGRVLSELARVLAPQGRLLMVVPMEWELHQIPHDYYRYTAYGLRYLARQAGLRVLYLEPVGGFFRLLARRLLNGLQFLPWPVMLVVAVLVTPVALLLPLLDPLDRDRRFTLGYICVAEKPA